MGGYYEGEFNSKHVSHVLMDGIIQHFIAGLLPSVAAAKPK